MISYANSGVDVDLEAQASKILYKAARSTWNNRKCKLGEIFTPYDDFSGLRAVDIGGLPKGTVLNIGFDGVGTKSEFASMSGRYDTMGYDLMAMVCDDAVIRGGEPVLVGSILDIDSLGDNADRLNSIKQIAKGYVAAANVADVAIINGELAQLGDTMPVHENLSLNWGASVVWVAHRDRLLTGQAIQPGDALVGLQETSLRSNGISLVRTILKATLGSNWVDQKLASDKLIDLALAPSTIYSPLLVAALGGWSLEQKPLVAIHGAANITGGGLPEKLGRMLKPSGYGAELHNLYTPPKLMRYCQELGDVSDEEAYRTWHMGQGMVIATPEPEKFIALCDQQEYTAKVIGEVTSKPGIQIYSNGYFSKTTPKLRF